MAKAFWDGTLLAESDRTEVVENNHYFPPESVRRELLQPSSTQTVCGWKGTASYYHIDVAGKRNEDAAWYYQTPLPAAAQIAGHIAFWKGVRIEP